MGGRVLNFWFGLVGWEEWCLCLRCEVGVIYVL